MLTERTLFWPEYDQQDWFLMTCLCLVIFELFRYIALVNELTKRYLNRKEDEITNEITNEAMNHLKQDLKRRLLDKSLCSI